MSEKVVELPLSLYCQPCEPARAAQYKVGTPQYTTVYHSIPQYILPQVTVDTNHPVVSLHALFPSLLPIGEEGGPQNAMGFRLLAGPEVTIVASKSSGNESFSRIVYHQAVIWLQCCWTGRYRIQSESFPAIAGFLEELLTRLACYYTKQVSNPSLPLPSPHFPSSPSLISLLQEPQFQASYTSPLPLTEYFEFIEQHFKVGSSSSLSYLNTLHIPLALDVRSSG